MRDWCAGLTEDQRDAVVEMLTARAMRGQEASFECMSATSMICKFHMENNRRRYKEHCAAMAKCYGLCERDKVSGSETIIRPGRRLWYAPWKRGPDVVIDIVEEMQRTWPASASFKLYAASTPLGASSYLAVPPSSAIDAANKYSKK